MALAPVFHATVTALADARRQAGTLATFPGLLPDTLADAYAVQQAVLRDVGGAVLGWKVGRIPPARVAELAEERLAGPILSIAEATGGFARVFAGGAGAVEAEFMLRLAHIPERIPRDLDEARQVVDRVCAGIEIASSPVRTIHDYAPFGIIADLGINNGNQLGPGFDRDGGFEHLEISTTIDGEVVGAGRAADVLDGPFGAVRFVIGLHLAGTITLSPGQWISAGAITGVHPIRPGQRAEINFGGRVIMACTAIAAVPQAQFA